MADTPQGYRDTCVAPSLTDEIAAAVKRGVKTGASKLAVRKLVSAVRQIAGESYPAFFDSALGRQIESGIVCAGVLLLVNSWEGMPKRDLIKSVALAGVEDNGQQTVALVEAFVSPMIEGLALQLAESKPKQIEDAVKQLEAEVEGE